MPRVRFQQQQPQIQYRPVYNGTLAQQRTQAPRQVSIPYGTPHPIQLVFTAISRDDVSYLAFVINQQPNLCLLQNQQGKTLLMMALSCNAIQCLKFLCQVTGVNKDQQDKEGETVLYQASASGNFAAVTELLNSGVGIDVANKVRVDKYEMLLLII